MSLEVIDVSGLATLQDTGRTGWRQFGVPVSGPMDPFAFQAANLLAGNPGDAAAVEIGLGDAVFVAKHDCVVAITGAGYRLSIYVWEFALWSSFFVRAGWQIRLSKTGGGMWAYLAVSGGIQAGPVLGSRSTYLRGHLGGLAGRPLQAGDMLPRGHSIHGFHALAARTLPEGERPKYGSTPLLEVILGPQTGYFTEKSLETFLSSEYSVSYTSDRMGYRLEGPHVGHRGKTELISEGMTSGAIQVPSDGAPIVIMADGPTTGGYPKIGTIVRADLPLLAQCVPNQSRVRFQETSVEEAQARYHRQMNGLNQIVQADEI